MTAKWKGIVGRAFTADEFADYCAELRTEERSWHPELIVVHNTQIPSLADWHNVPGAHRMAGLQSYYRDEMHWSAGPHLFVADDVIWIFTPLTTPGVHSPSWNAVSWGVETVGDYEREELPESVFNNLVSALVSLHRLGGFLEPTIRFHREDPRTTHHGCPGRNLDKAALVERIAAELDGFDDPSSDNPALADLAGLPENDER
jgi:hypothetical protein